MRLGSLVDRISYQLIDGEWLNAIPVFEIYNLHDQCREVIGYYAVFSLNSFSVPSYLKVDSVVVAYHGVPLGVDGAIRWSPADSRIAEYSAAGDGQ